MVSPSDHTVLEQICSRGSVPPATIDRQIGSRYSLIAPRGRGGIGEVWEAEQAPTGRRVAIKLLLPGWQTDQSIRKRFIREGRLASTMQHRHIVDIIEVGESRGSAPFIAMELLPGLSLDELMEQEGPLSWSRVRRILLQLCSALDHAHGLKIVHRDVKPSNIMLANRPGEPDYCKLVDFGIAKQTLVHLNTQHLTGEGQMLGSPGFMSPEQLRGRRTDVRGDIYGLGCTGFFLLTGRVPFEGNSVPEMIHNALYGSPRGLEGIDLDEQTRLELEAVLHRAVHRDPDQRYNSILDLVVALNQIERSPFASQSMRLTRTLVPVAKPPKTLAPEASPPTPVADIPAPAQSFSNITTQKGSISPPARPAATTEPALPPNPARGVISTQSRSHVLAGQATAERISWGSPDGFVDIARLPPNIIVVHMSGLIGDTAVWLFEQQLGPLLHRYKHSHLFFHLGTLERYPAVVRDASLRCLTEHRNTISSMHVLSSSGLIGMAVSLATVAIGSDSHLYEDQHSWQLALETWAEGQRRRPPP